MIAVIRQIRPWTLFGAGLFVVWATFTSFDPSFLTVSGVGPKIVFLFLALALWFPNRSRKPIPFAVPVLVVAIAVPLVWSIVATYYPHPYAGLSPSPTRMTAEHASHFLYLLIYLPIADLTVNHDGRAGVALWLLPAVGLCAVTWILYFLHSGGSNLGIEYTTRGLGALERIGPLQGIVSLPGEHPVRLFFGNHILLIPAAAALLGLALSSSQRRWYAGALLLVLTTLYPVQSRGITIGVLLVLAVVAAIATRSGRVWPAFLLCLGVVVLFNTAVDVRTAAFLHGEFGDLSSQQRVSQAPELIAGFRQRPILGSGLGATLPSGFVRSTTEPYSFELSYHQMLFQNGIVGLAVILALPIWAIVRTLMAVRFLRREDLGWAAAGVGAVTGLLFAGATNPLLASSFGMLALATALALCARAVALGSPPAIGWRRA
jgi:O-antigen ligase/polysaccharide polymerase Wzy-like membrane protein